jgi:hypothetical protein
MDRTCNMNGSEGEHVQVIDVKARAKETTRKTKVANIKMDF